MMVNINIFETVTTSECFVVAAVVFKCLNGDCKTVPINVRYC